MIYSTYRFTLDLQKHQSQQSIAVFQGDTAVRLYISLTDGGKPFVLPEGSFAVFSGKCANNEPLLHSCTICNNNTEIMYEFQGSTSAVVGVVNCQCRLYGSNQRLITAPRFSIVVEERIVNDDLEIEIPEGQLTALDDILLNETARYNAEIERGNAEALRADNENARIENEETRNQNESERQAAYEERVKAFEETATELGTTFTQTTEALTKSVEETVTTLEENAANRLQELKDYNDEVLSDISKVGEEVQENAKKVEDALAESWTFVEVEAKSNKYNLETNQTYLIKNNKFGSAWSPKVVAEWSGVLSTDSAELNNLSFDAWTDNVKLKICGYRTLISMTNKMQFVYEVNGTRYTESFDDTNGSDRGVSFYIKKETTPDISVFKIREDAQVEGLQGKQGIEGKSAYDIAKEKGFAGTKTAWLASLKGEQGQKGEPGKVNVVQTLGDSKTDAMSQKATTEAIEAVEGSAKVYPTEFTNGVFSLGVGVSNSSVWIITPKGKAITKGDKIKISPNGLVVCVYIESVSDLAEVTTHILDRANIAEDTEIIAPDNGYVFFQIRNASWSAMLPENYNCDITVGESRFEVLDNKIEEAKDELNDQIDNIKTLIGDAVSLVASDFEGAYFNFGTGLVTSEYCIITPKAKPIKEGDKIFINPNGLNVHLMIESVDDLSNMTNHLLDKSGIKTETEIISNYNGYAFFEVRTVDGNRIKPEDYRCEITIGVPRMTELEDRMEKLENDMDIVPKTSLFVSPKHKPFTTIIDDCQDASKWNITNTSSDIPSVDTTNFIFGNQSLRSDKLMRCSKQTYDMVNNDLVVRFKINSIAQGARLHLKVANTYDWTTIAWYTLDWGTVTTFPNGWQEAVIPYTGYSTIVGEGEIDFTKIDDILIQSSEGYIDWNLQYIGIRPKRMRQGIVTFTFDDGYKTQYTGIKLLAEKGITSTLFHVKEATDKGSSEYLSIADLQNLVNHYGADIEVHGDPSYDEWEESALLEHWQASQKFLRENGLSEGRYMAYPENKFPLWVVQHAKCYFESCRTINPYIPIEAYPPSDKYRVRAVSSIGANGTTADKVKQYIDKAVSSGAWLVLVFHRIGDGDNSMWCSEADLKDIADYAISSGAYIMNYAEVFDSVCY